MPSQVFKVMSIYEYVSQHDDDLHFSMGQIIDVTNEEDDEWYSGEYIDESGIKQEGIFPKNFVEKYETAAPPRPICANHPTKGTESTNASLDLLSAKLETPFTAENITVDPAPVTPPHRQSPPQKPSPKTNVLDSSPFTPVSKLNRSSPPSRLPSFEKPSPPPIFEKPASNSFKDRVAAFNKASSSVPGPFKPGSLASGDVSSFIKKPFIAPPPSKDAYIPLPRDHSISSKFARKEADQGLAKKESERQIKNEKFSFEPTDLKDLINTDVKPTSLKERIALLQKQQIEHAPRIADAAHKKEKVRRPVKKHVEPTTQAEVNEQKNSTSLEKTDLKGASRIKSLEEDETSIPDNRKSSDESPCPRTSSDDGNDVDAPRDSEDITGNGDKFKLHGSLKNNEDEQNTISQSGDFDAKNVVSTEQGDEEDDDQDGEDEENGEIEAEIKRKEELRARMAKMSGGMNMHAILGPLAGIPMPSVIIPKKKSNNPSHENDRKEESPILTPQKESFTAIPLPGMAQIKPQDERQNENSIVVLTPMSPQASPKIEGIDSNHNQVTSSQESSISTEGSPEEKSIPPIPKDIESNDDSIMPLTSVVDSDDEPLPQAQNLSPSTLYAPQDHNGQKKEQLSLQKPLHVDKESVVETDWTSPISPVNSSQNNRASILPPPIPSGINSFQIDSQKPMLQESSTTSRSPTYDQQTYSHVIPPQIPSEDSDDNMSNESHYEDDIAPKDHYIGISKAHNKYLKNDDDLHLNSLINPPNSAHSTQSETFRKNPPNPLQLASNKRLSIDMPRSAPPPPPSKVSSWEKTNEDFESQSNLMPNKRALSVPSSNATTPEYEKTEDDIYSASPPRSSYTMPERNPPPLPPRDSVAPYRDSIDIARSL
ncbi:putative sh3 domain-containing protein [Erysiphe neolycopersici]|uniref:Putative sh3 domain-containing protein n=1 Tax=Erysiphe neolycopersici TaxID=212602 RepID=A0A420I2D2_9PEZI|nr:putative sh3 domain-containing protein [Erysiphe neolycopersici]